MREAKSDNALGAWYRFGAYVYDLELWFLWLFLGGIGNWRAAFCDMIKPGADEKIAELCCGTGSVALRLAKTAGAAGIAASDLSADQLRIARLKARLTRSAVEFSVQDASNTSHPSAHFDKVVISVALHEIVRGRRRAIYREVKRILKPGGCFCVSEPSRPGNLWGGIWFKILFNPLNPETPTVLELIDGGLESELADAGFHVEDCLLTSYDLIKNLRCSAT
jgi:demethylmenaquinone methyltransferase/2-methoxy-6-polyprenyl-1,4-benzoquinol methylase